MNTILIVDDDAEYRSLLSEKLKSIGFSVKQAKNGEEGLRILKNSPCDLILLDLVMTQMDGLKFYRLFKKFGIKKIPILILSNILLSDLKKIAKKPGVVDYIIKADVNLDQVSERIVSILSKKK